MAVFVVRRMLVSALTLLAVSFVVYILVANSGDPIGDLRTDPSPNRDDKIAARVDALNLDQAPPVRYLTWLRGTASCLVPGGGCDLGVNLRGQEVSTLTAQAMGATLRLVVIATVVALLIGVGIGITSALRQYTGFDYSITFSAFFFFSVPTFVLAVLLKQYLAIAANDWLRDPTVGVIGAVLLAALSAMVWGSLIGGPPRRRWIVRAVAGVVTFGLLLYLSAAEWFLRPQLGPVLIAVFAFALALGVAELIAGLSRRRVLYAALTMAGIGTIAQFPVIGLLESRTWATWGTVIGLLAATIVTGVVVGFLIGGLDKGQAVWAGVLTGVLTGGVIVLDILLRTVPSYSRLQRGRIFSTVGSGTPNFDGTFWQRVLDSGSHLVLPTIALAMVSFAQYSRYSRSSMLEVMNQDYVRTARAKGLTERTVVMRHAFRNAMIPLATVAAIDFGAVLGGAVITENVFGWRGMGRLFIEGLYQVDPNPVMAFFVVTATALIVFNLIADIAYAYLDPRIRIG